LKKLCYIVEATEGGVRKHLRDLIRVFSRPEEGFEIHGIFGDRGEPGFREELAQLQISHTLVPPFKRPIRALNDIRAYTAVKDQLRRIAPDIVHTHSAKAGFIGRTAAQHLGLKNVVHTAHVFPFQWAEGLQARLYLALERQCARHSRALICVGESQRADALARGLAPAEKLIVVRNGLELPAVNESEALTLRSAARKKLDLAENATVIGMVARLAPQKGIKAFVSAAARVLEKRPDVVFCVVGGGPLDENVRAGMSQLKLPPEHFRLLGHRQDAAELYPAFDVAMLSSLYEGLPYVLLEAMAWAVPVIATDVLGSRDVVADGETGFLARVNDPAHIAEKTLLLIDDEPLRRRQGQAARKRVETEFSFAKFVEGHRALYRN
jgi:glycosyltransferase involved in cell wall biosynthesis